MFHRDAVVEKLNMYHRDAVVEQLNMFNQDAVIERLKMFDRSKGLVLKTPCTLFQPLLFMSLQSTKTEILAVDADHKSNVLSNLDV